jgi:tetratricopeptide (TPR) repeat protein
MLPMAALAMIHAVPAISQTAGSEWESLIDAKKYAEAQTLCKSWTKSPNLHKRVEAEKCLANVALSKGQIVSLLAGDTGGGSLGGGYTPEAIDEALKHLNAGIALDPQDLSIHMGRLHILEVSGHFDQMVKYLDDSLSVYTGTDSRRSFLQYAFELGDMQQAKAGLRFCEVMNKYFPNDHEIVGNIGAFHGMLGEHDQALIYIRKAVELAPTDAMDAWNLGWNLKGSGQSAEADKWLLKSLALQPSSTEMPDRQCLYARFVELDLKDVSRACKLERASCTREEQTACKHPQKPAAAKP